MTNIRDNSKMLLIEDNGGGMTSDKMRHCMSLGYSAKSKIANTIGQYGNGFKTSTMRLGADVVVFSRCMDGNRRSASQSIGMLSYTFLMGTQKEDIVVPMIDFEKKGQVWEKVIRSSSDDWSSNLETILQWSPFTSERNLLKQFDFIESQGTRIFIYNLWEDDEGKLELDFETDPQDIRIRVVNQNKQSTERALLHPNSRHFLTYKHSLRSYASILYLRVPPKFRIILRGCDVQHHSIVNDMLHKQQITYRPQSTTEMSTQHTWMVATVTIGFVKDAHFHGDIQGFNVYHKNRLIKPFWRVWNAAGSSGRGAIGVLEANFVEPAHDKQDFERTIALSRLEARLIVIQKAYWFENCHLIGYSDERSKKRTSPHSRQELVAQPSYRSRLAALSAPPVSGNASQVNPPIEFDRTPTPIAEIPNDRSSPVVFCDINDAPQRAESVKIKNKDKADSSNAEDGLIAVNGPSSTCVSDSVVKLKQENLDLTRIIDETETRVAVLRGNITLQRDKRESFEKQLVTARRKIEELEKEQAALIKMISEERMQGEEEEEKLRQKLAEASDNIDYLLDKVKRLQEK
ncbi:hypothetical protein SAY87_013069 [Trapa incisa]|uniref:Morc S5 domain-containing protein n=1 Tax=Trapa incisa TaxID=236973 RepID=A0AAN7KB86_9MYRT|nr:hypothetical protein SAY87_013069 [Trapa incisa]